MKADANIGHGQVGYKAPVPASTSLICTASLDSLNGRKAWVSAQVLDRPGGTLYATGKALFVIPKVCTVQRLRCNAVCIKP